jgi:hypothetical protein
MTRKFLARRRITIETINGEAAAHSPYVETLRTVFDVLVDYKTVTLYRKREG